MKNKWAKKKKMMDLVAVVFAVLFFVQIFVGEKVEAVPNGFNGDYQACLDASGRGDIASVQETCSWKGSNACSLWLGPADNSYTTTIDISEDYPYATKDLAAWGMCTSPNKNTTAYNVKIENDGGSISGGGSSFARGNWGDPASLIFTLNIEAFKNGASRQETSDGIYYTRTISIYREHCKFNSKGTCLGYGDSDNASRSEATIRIKTPPSHLGQSWIDNTYTSITKGSEERSKDYWLRPNQKIQVNFTHYLYSKSQTSNVLWRIVRNGFVPSNGNYTISPASNAATSDRGSLNSWNSNGYYAVASSKTYDMKFAAVGSYPTFCERFYYNYEKNYNNTRVCGNVYVPYNFVNTATVDISGDVVYAGEKTNLKNFSITTNPTYNSTVRATYATVSPNTRTKIVTYVSGSNDTRGYQVISGTNPNLCSGFSYQNGHCSVTDSTSSQSINSNNNINGQTVSPNINQTYNVYDTKAGNYFCVAAAVYPYTSGSTTNYSNGNGSNSWYISKPSCRKVAKRPSFEVWGGSFYSNGNVRTGESNKNNLEGVSGYGYSSTGGNIRAYGSWIESGISSTGIISGLSSGAATGSTADGIGGSKEGTAANYCKYRTPLSFSNYSNIGTLCPNTEATGQIGNAGAKLDKNSLVEYIARGTTTNTDGNNIDINGKNNYTETTSENNVNIRYTYKDGDISLRGTTVEKNVTHVVRASGTITINGDITYADEDYKNLDEIPKLILYAENINIACGVKRLDAIIIANKTVNTCSDSNDINSRANSNQLRINGVIIADKLELKRTYGAATGTNSGEPAEIINYDTSIILWSNAMTDTGSSNVMTATYQRELAPRY